MSDILIACLGNEMVGDDALGPTIWKLLREKGVPEGVRLELFACGGLGLIDKLCGEKLLIVVDAIRGLAFPGQVAVRRWHDLPHGRGRPVTSHDIGLREVLEITSDLFPDRVPGEVIFIGVEGRNFTEVGTPMSAEVQAAVPRVLRTIRRYLDCHLGGSPFQKGLVCTG